MVTTVTDLPLLKLQDEARNSRAAVYLGIVLHIVGIVLSFTISPWWLFMACAGFLLVVSGLLGLALVWLAYVDHLEAKLRREFGVMAR